VGAYSEGDTVLCPGTGALATGVVREVHEDGTYTVDCEGEKGAIFHPLGLHSVPGSFGFWASRSCARIRGAAVADLKELVDSIGRQAHLMAECSAAMRAEEEHHRVQMLRGSRAARLIQEVCRVRLCFVRQRMKRYHQAEKQGMDDTLREKKLLTWFALLSVLQRFNEVMTRPAELEQQNRRYLELLDREAPPPPPPPLKEPPKVADEELHYRYRERRQKYAHAWEKAGRRVVGQEAFDRIRNLESGPAEQEKQLVAQKCYDHAMEAMSEQEHQEYLQRAWRLENDWASLDDPQTAHEFERWRDEKARAAAPKRPAAARGKSSAG